MAAPTSVAGANTKSGGQGALSARSRNEAGATAPMAPSSTAMAREARPSP